MMLWIRTKYAHIFALTWATGCAGELAIPLDELVGGGGGTDAGQDEARDAGTPADGADDARDGADEARDGSDEARDGADEARDGEPDEGSDGAPAEPVEDEAVTRGRALYGAQCAFCHAEDGTGGVVMKPLTAVRPADELANVIDTQMPPGSESNCDAQCASDIAAFILAEFAQ